MDDITQTDEAMDWPHVRQEAVSLIEAASERSAHMRLVGSVAIRLHAPEMDEMMGDLRPPPKDLDFVCPKRDRATLRKLLDEHGYENDRNMMVAMEGLRYLFIHRDTGLKLDLFVDRLDFCHRIVLSGRLDAHPLTIPTEELLLHKLQIVELTAGDVIDLGVILANIDLDGVGTSLSVERFSEALANDWGFWRTAKGNLEAIGKHASDDGYRVLSAQASERIARTAETLHSAIDTCRKGFRWKMRAKVGERVRWWQEVDDREGTY